MPSVTRLRICSDTSSSASASRAQRERLLEARLGVERLQQLHLALDRQVGRPARGVGERAGVVDAGERVGEAGRCPSFSAMPRTTARYSRTISLGPAGHRGRLGHGLGLDPQPGLVARDGARRRAARDRPRRTRARCAAGQLALVLDPGDGADPGVAGADPGHEEDPAVAGDGAVGGVTRLGGLERQGHDHLGQHDPGGQGQQRQVSGLRVSGHRGLRALGDYTIT